MTNETTTTKVERQTPGLYLAPTECATEEQVLDEVMTSGRKKAVLATDDEGTLIVCCARTARKHGWKIEGTFYGKPPKPAAEKTTKKAARLASLEAIDKELAKPAKKDIHAASNARIAKVMAEEKATTELNDLIS